MAHIPMLLQLCSFWLQKKRGSAILASMSTDRDHHFMREALKEAHEAYRENEVPVGAVLIIEDQC